MSLDFKPSTKKMKKRKELDALVSSDKILKLAPNGGATLPRGLNRKSSRTHQLLDESATNSENDMQQELSGDGETYTQMGDRRFRRRQNASGCGCSTCGHRCLSFFGICSFLLTLVSIVGLAGLAWMHMELKREVQRLREDLNRAVETDGRRVIDLQRLDTGLKSVGERLEAVVKGKGGIEELSTTMTKQGGALDGLKASVMTLQRSLASAPDIVAIPKQLAALKKDVATIGSNLATAQADVKKLQAKTASLGKESVRLGHVVDHNLGHNVVASLNASIVSLDSKLAVLDGAFHGKSGLNEELQSLKGRVDSLYDLVGYLQKQTINSKPEVATTTTTSVPVTPPATNRENGNPPIMISAQPIDVTGVVGETTTSSSPAADLNSSPTAALKSQDKLARIGSLLSSSTNKTNKHKP